jgi:uncharacterized protein YjiS (DUF1127 family)
MKSFTFLGFLAGVAALGRPVAGRASAGQALPPGLQAAAERGALMLRLWRRRSRDRRHLMELSDYMLKDIGITRDERESEISRPFWRQ